jgi:dimeric dUTPase (all-alpha-NTP-PPase superfamily)
MAMQADIMRQVMAQQLQLQRESFGVDPTQLEGEDRDHFVQAMSTALVVELGEALQEISWKPWASGQWFRREAYLEELIDVLHFWMNLVLVATDRPEELLTAYMIKHDVNAKRQADGYTGDNKCPECGR